MSTHRKQSPRRVRPRLRRIAAASVSTVITTVALLGAAGVIPLGGAGSAATRDLADTVVGVGAPQDPGTRSRGTDLGETSTPTGSSGTGTTSGRTTTGKAPAKTTSTTSTKLPTSSGTGKRVVFSKSAQRVWLVSSQGTPLSTYLVSGSVTNNLEPGKYHVYSRSRWAVGVDDSGVMQYFVRFAHGPQAAIGFHSIPTKLGKPLQKISQLGTPQSHGCIRQKLTDAERMWSFATTGTEVVVVA
ncbi:L,D-transpeptidase [Nocardioides marmorisolisilvae]|uniref:Murein L,D-transpeptidase n=1 Tax=Nocardioides marmorisolisilvae TaxID=1542737 RepID=A0A3N0DNQ4_9ACTN|nr:L,D-transpeptidase [Nocardioides marmorisolisilvae]RNL77282.1 murein L,D-transpeptidase [Nocardioides marmorisolisilvae]